MKKIIFSLFLLISLSIGLFAQNDPVIAYTFGINSGADNNINAYRFNPNSAENSFSAGNVHFNIGVDYGMMISKRLRPRIELKYVEMSYNAGWEETNVSTIKESIVKLSNFNINFRLDYLLLSSKKFQVFVSPGLKWEFPVTSQEKNIKYDGTYNWANYNGISSANPGSLLGGAVSTILKYNFTKKVALTVTPEYTLFFKEFSSGNNKSFQRTSINFGFEFNFY
jgi:hypothetical protein